MFWRKKPAPPPAQQRRPIGAPDLREVIVVTARSRELAVSPEWVERVVTHAETLPSMDAVCDYLEQEFDAASLGALTETINRRRAELRRLNRQRRQMAAAGATS